MIVKLDNWDMIKENTGDSNPRINDDCIYIWDLTLADGWDHGMNPPRIRRPGVFLGFMITERG